MGGLGAGGTKVARSARVATVAKVARVASRDGVRTESGLEKSGFCLANRTQDS